LFGRFEGKGEEGLEVVRLERKIEKFFKKIMSVFLVNTKNI